MAGRNIRAIQLRIAFQNVERAFEVAGVQVDFGIGLQIDRHVERIAEDLDRRFFAIGTSGDHAQQGASAALLRQAGGGMVIERRCGFFGRARQRDPGLHAVQRVRAGALGAGRAFGMGDAAAGGHPVDVAGANHLIGAERVAVADLAGPQEGDRGQADMRMRAHVDAVIRFQHGRAHLVDEHERSHTARLQGGHGATHLQPADVVHAWGDQGGHGGGSRRSRA